MSPTSTLTLICTFTLTLIYDLQSKIIPTYIHTYSIRSGPTRPSEITFLGFCGIGNNQASDTRH